MEKFSLPLKVDTTYSITENFTINGEVNIPQGVTLIFQGGKLVGKGKLIGNNTKIVAPISQIFGEELNVTDGNWCIDRAYPQWFGVNDNADLRTNTVDDAAPAINKAIKFKKIGEVFIPRGQYVIKDSIQQQFGIILCGEIGEDRGDTHNINQGTVISPMRNHTLDGGYMVLVNVKKEDNNIPISIDNANWIVEYSHEHTAIKNIYFSHHFRYNTEGHDDEVTGIKGIIYAGNISIEHCAFYGLLQGATSTYHYSDVRSITDCTFNPEVDPAEINKEKEEYKRMERYYAFDFAYSGDSVTFKRNTVNVWDVHGNAILGGLKVGGAFGVDISCNIINHHVYLVNTRSVSFYGNHMENTSVITSQLQIQSSTAKVFANYFENGDIPKIKIFPAEDYSDINAPVVSLENNDFCYYENYYERMTKYGVEHYNAFDIQLSQWGNLNLDNNYRYDMTGYSTEMKRPKGIMLCDMNGMPISEFNNYSYFLSQDSKITSPYHINYNHSIITTENLGVAWLSQDSGRLWIGGNKYPADISYNYYAQVIWDINRKIVGKTVFLRQGLTPTVEGKIGGFVITLGDLEECGNNCIIRFSRVSSVGTQICDVPLCGSTGVWDNGFDICGFRWREKLSLDDMSNAISPKNTVQFVGNNIVCNAISQPVAGTWKNGDKVYNVGSGNTAFWIYNNGWQAK